VRITAQLSIPQGIPSSQPCSASENAILAIVEYSGWNSDVAVGKMLGKGELTDIEVTLGAARAGGVGVCVVSVGVEGRAVDAAGALAGAAGPQAMSRMSSATGI
jgi:hypothetical protein